MAASFTFGREGLTTIGYRVHALEENHESPSVAGLMRRSNRTPADQAQPRGLPANGIVRSRYTNAANRKPS